MFLALFDNLHVAYHLFCSMEWMKTITNLHLGEQGFLSGHVQSIDSAQHVEYGWIGTCMACYLALSWA